MIDYLGQIRLLEPGRWLVHLHKNPEKFSTPRLKFLACPYNIRCNNLYSILDQIQVAYM